MLYYSEDDMKDLRKAFEKEVMAWEDITTKKMFGCPCYRRNGQLFVFLVTGGLVITKLDDQALGDLSKVFKVEPFTAGSRKVTKWARVPYKKSSDLKKLLPDLA